MRITMPTRQVDDERDRLIDLDALARRSLLILCVVYLALGAFDCGRFMTTDLADLRGAAAAATAAVDELAGRIPPAAEAELDAARAALADAAAAARRGWVRAAALLTGLIVIGAVLVGRRRRTATRGQIVSTATFMIVILGVLLLASRLALQRAIPDQDLPAWGLLDLLVLHVAASIVLPWTVRESILPFGLLLIIWAITFLVPHQVDPDLQLLDRIFIVLVSWLVLLPGVGITIWRRRRLEENAERLRLNEQVRTLGGEISRARVVHDSMFPRPFDAGHVRFEYDYRPSAEIGGDFVHLHRCPRSGRFYLTLLDVAGHGLAAALTVNRLYGELERIRAEDPDAEPDAVIRLLNRYINLTMAAHNLYATGLCIMLDAATGAVKWVNAGHPPGLLRKADGRVSDLPGTTMLLGVLSDDEFGTNQQTTRIEPGDVVIAFTDGAFEARNAEGRRFGLDALRDTAGFNPPPRDWTRFIANAVSKHHGGHAEDDVLVASLHLRGLHVAELRGEDAPAAVREPVGAEG